MRVLFDQGTPVPLRRLLRNNQVETAFERGWHTLTNGELLAAAERDGFEILLTTDKNLRYHKTPRADRSRLLYSRPQAGRIFKGP